MVTGHQRVQYASMGRYTVLVYHTGTGMLRFFAAKSWIASETRQALTFWLMVNYTARGIFGTWVIVCTWFFTFFINASLKVSTVRIMDTFNYLTLLLRIPCSAWRTLTLCLVVAAHTYSTWWAQIVFTARINALVMLAHFCVRTIGVIFTVNC